MRSSLRRVAGTTAAVLSCALALGACGGGGGSAPAPVTAPSFQPAAPKSTVRATLQSALYAVANAHGVTISSQTLFGLARRVQAIRHGRRPLSAAPACSNGQASVGPVTNPDGSQTVTTSFYYDVACTQLEALDVMTLTQSSPSAFAATDVLTTYDRTGGVTSYTTATLQGSTGAGQDRSTIVATVAKDATSAWFAKIGMTCTGPSTGTSIHCGLADVGTVNGSQNGAALDQATSYAISGQTTTATVNVTASAYSAPSGLDIAAGPVPVWTVTGAPPLDTVTGTITISSSGAGTTGGSVSLSDAHTGIAVSGTMAPAGSTFTLAQNGAQLATATVDVNGTGTVRYADGTTEQITNWTIRG
jgi:hypothetical protein